MTQMKTSSDEMKVAIIANGKPQSRRVASKLFNAFRDDPDFYLTKKIQMWSSQLVVMACCYRPFICMKKSLRVCVL